MQRENQSRCYREQRLYNALQLLSNHAFLQKISTENRRKMKLFVFSLLIAFASADDDKIIGGTPLEPNQIPYLINLRRFGSLICGGSLISSRFALSAAHCNVNAASLTVVAGDYSLSTNENTEQVSEVVRTLPHPDYSTETLANDIMLLELLTYIEETAYVQYAILPEPFVDPNEGTECNVYGWGNTQIVGSNYPDTPYGVTIPLISNADCNAAYNGGIYDGMMCLGVLGTGGIDSCQGDSGGPVYCNDALHGVVSWGIGCAYPNFPGVYTRVSHYISFIEAYTS